MELNITRNDKRGHMTARLGAAIVAVTIASLWVACSEDPPVQSSSSGGIYRLPCETADDCPDPLDRRCGKATCVDGECGLDLLTEIKSQFRGDCRTEKCDDKGWTYDGSNPSDVFDDGNPCTDDVCVGVLRPSNQAVARGPAPGGVGFCTGGWNWVECLTHTDCNDPSLYCSPNSNCVPTLCGNRTLDPSIGESAIDCGGQCDPCVADRACNVDEDCDSGLCDPNVKRCTPSSCNDGKQNRRETGIDCGSACIPCSDGSGCRVHADCQSSVCWAGICQVPTCEDGRLNGDEEKVDCGGSCPSCR
jgi:hypothetical protein